MAREPLKKSTPAPLPHAREQGLAPRPLAPIARSGLRSGLVGRLAIPIGLATGLALTSAGVALEIVAERSASDAVSSCPRGDAKHIEQGFTPRVLTRPYIASVPHPPNVAGGIGPIHPSGHVEPKLMPVAHPAPSPILPLPRPPRLGGAVAMPTND